jgi:hypothetical protein
MAKSRNSKKVKKNSRRPVVKGTGDYTIPELSNKVDALERRIKVVPDTDEAVSHVGKLAQGAGTALGNMVLPGIGGQLGRMAGGGLAKLFGFGDYNIQSNSLMSGMNSTEKFTRSKSDAISASFGTQGRGVRIKEREYIGDVVGTTLFTSNKYAINPGLNTTFPWLSQIAANFDQWEPHGIVFEYKSLSTNYAATTTLGAVILATDYQALDGTYYNKLQMEESDYSNSTRPDDDCLHGIECSPKERNQNVYYVRNGPLSGTNNAALNQYDLGQFQLATQGTAVATLGELWITYDISFYKKNLFTSQVGTPNLWCTFIGSGSGGFLGSTYHSYGTLPVTYNNTLSTLTFPANIYVGFYLFTYTWSNTGAVALTAPSLVANGPCDLTDYVGENVGITNSGVGSQQAPNAGATSSRGFMQFYINIYGTGASVSMSGGALGTLGNAAFMIVQLPTNAINGPLIS